ncbi:MAG TPA: RNA polymerase sigma factor region1.1 domain-containing protein [Tepidisphaeraceae bacterium]|jgi:RNA polymerase primary sigma factor
MASSAEDSNNRVEAVLRLGERNGFLTYQMLNELLPDEMVTPTKLDSILIEINERRIRLIDETDVDAP